MKKPSPFHWWMLVLILILLVGAAVLLRGVILGNALPPPRTPGTPTHVIRRLFLG